MCGGGSFSAFMDPPPQNTSQPVPIRTASQAQGTAFVVHRYLTPMHAFVIASTVVAAFALGESALVHTLTIKDQKYQAGRSAGEDATRNSVAPLIRDAVNGESVEYKHIQVPAPPPPPPSFLHQRLDSKAPEHSGLTQSHGFVRLNVQFSTPFL